jgi:1,4-alpha-glucan branching enzyme
VRFRAFLSLLTAVVMFAESPAYEVRADRTVVFRFKAPEAVAVAVHLSDSRWPMLKGKDGVWTGTAGPLQPGTYHYEFVLNGPGKMFAREMTAGDRAAMAGTFEVRR